MDIIDELRSYRVETDLASWHPEICDRAADCITDLMARCDRLEEARENSMVKTCSTCDWWASDPMVWVCLNGDSEHCADFTDPDDTCPCWENYDLEMWGEE